MSIDLNRFDEIKHTPLRVYNRLVFMQNLQQDSGKDAAKLYAEQFTDGERKQMYVMAAYMKQHGQEATAKTVTKGLELVDA